MNNLKNDNRMVIPLALIALSFSGLAIVRVFKAGSTVPPEYNPINLPDSSVSSSALPPVTVDTGKAQPAFNVSSRNPFWHQVLKQKMLAQTNSAPPLPQSSKAIKAILPQNSNEISPFFHAKAGQNGNHPSSAPVKIEKTSDSDVFTTPLLPTVQKVASYRLMAVIISETPVAILIGPQNETIYAHINDKLPSDGQSMDEIVVAIDAQCIILSTVNASRRLMIEYQPLNQASTNPPANTEGKSDVKSTTEEIKSRD